MIDLTHPQRLIVEAELAESRFRVGLPVGGAERGGEMVDEPVLRAGEAGAGEGGFVSMNR